jgi:hypothetical protein
MFRYGEKCVRRRGHNALYSGESITMDIMEDGSRLKE